MTNLETEVNHVNDVSTISTMLKKLILLIKLTCLTMLTTEVMSPNLNPIFQLALPILFIQGLLDSYIKSLNPKEDAFNLNSTTENLLNWFSTRSVNYPLTLNMGQH